MRNSHVGAGAHIDSRGSMLTSARSGEKGDHIADAPVVSLVSFGYSGEGCTLVVIMPHPAPDVSRAETKSITWRQLAAWAGWLLAWFWALFGIGGGLWLMITRGPLPLTNGWFILFSGLAACPLIAMLWQKLFRRRLSGSVRLIAALLFVLAGRIALLIGTAFPGCHVDPVSGRRYQAVSIAVGISRTVRQRWQGMPSVAETHRRAHQETQEPACRLYNCLLPGGKPSISEKFRLAV